MRIEPLSQTGQPMCKVCEAMQDTIALSRKMRDWSELEQEVGELKGVIGQKTLEVDFFADALRRVEESRQRKSKSGATASTPRSAGGCNRKVD